MSEKYSEKLVEIENNASHAPVSQLEILTEQLVEAQEQIEQLKVYKKEYVVALNHIEELRRTIKEKEELYNSIINSVYWKITKPLRLIARTINQIPLFRLMIRGYRYLKKNGYRRTIDHIRERHAHRLDFSSAKWLDYSQDQIDRQRQEQFSNNNCISVVVPLYNTSKRFLQELICSVRDQTYANWELCLADGSDEKHSYVGKICHRCELKDHRIRYKKIKSNRGISDIANACIDMAAGGYIALLDHQDLLHPAALYEAMTMISNKDADFVYTDEIMFRETPEDAFAPQFKPDYAPDSLRSTNYINRLTVFKKCLMNATGYYRPECEGSQDYDMILRLTEHARNIVHIPKALYYHRTYEGPAAGTANTETCTTDAAHKALGEHLERIGLAGAVSETRVSGVYRIRYELVGTPLVSILIPNYEHKEDLETCLNSVFEKTTYANFEIIIIENNSQSKEIFDYYEEIQKRWRNVKVVRWEEDFNYSAINNFGAAFASGEHLLLLNNDIKVITPDWIQEMLMFSQRSDVGAVGAMLYYPDDTIQHAGVILGICGVGGNSHKNFKRSDVGYMDRLVYAQNLTAVTAACLMLRRSVWNEMGGLDESFRIAFNDMDLCMRIRKSGYLIVWTPFAELYHYESKSRGSDEYSAKRKRFEREAQQFQNRWSKALADGDPYYNPNLNRTREDFSFGE